VIGVTDPPGPPDGGSARPHRARLLTVAGLLVGLPAALLTLGGTYVTIGMAFAMGESSGEGDDGWGGLILMLGVAALVVGLAALLLAIGCLQGRPVARVLMISTATAGCLWAAREWALEPEGQKLAWTVYLASVAALAAIGQASRSRRFDAARERAAR
jgi:hypothetical protein